jgi:hypothetical protein
MSTIKCKFCDKIVCKTSLSKHIDSHDLLEIEKSKLYQSCLDDNVYTKMLYYTDFTNYLFKENIISTYKEFLKFVQKHAGKINSFVKLLEQHRPFKDIDCKLYFDKYASYKKEHPKDVLSRQLASCFCHDENDAEDFYLKVLKPKNAYTGHDGRLSPWSNDFVGYNHLSDEDKNKARRQKCYCSDRDDYDQIKVACNTNLQFYLNKGMSEDEAKIALRKRQTTFSLEKCIEKYGEVEGIKRFKERQEKWRASLNTPENLEILIKARINGFKACNKTHYSKISQELFDFIKNRLIKNNLLNQNEIFYATNNEEFIVKCKNYKAPMLDFYIPSLNKWIEFDGEFWHSDKFNNDEKDQQREQYIFEAIPGIQLKRIKERDYKKDPEKIVNECVEWILK